MTSWLRWRAFVKARQRQCGDDLCAFADSDRNRGRHRARLFPRADRARASGRSAGCGRPRRRCLAGPDPDPAGRAGAEAISTPTTRPTPSFGTPSPGHRRAGTQTGVADDQRADADDADEHRRHQDDGRRLHLADRLGADQAVGGAGARQHRLDEPERQHRHQQDRCAQDRDPSAPDHAAERVGQSGRRQGVDRSVLEGRQLRHLGGECVLDRLERLVGAAGQFDAARHVGPGSSCPYSTWSNGFGCTSGPSNTSWNTNTIPSSGTYTGYICPGRDNGRVDPGRNGHYYNGCYNSVAAGQTCSTNWWGGTSCTTSYTHTWIPNDTSTWDGCVMDRTQDYDTQNTRGHRQHRHAVPGRKRIVLPAGADFPAQLRLDRARQPGRFDVRPTATPIRPSDWPGAGRA